MRASADRHNGAGCTRPGCGGWCRVIATRRAAVAGDGKRRRRRCQTCGALYTSWETILPEGTHNAMAVQQSHRLLDALSRLEPEERAAIDAMVRAFDLRRRLALPMPNLLQAAVDVAAPVAPVVQATGGAA